MDGTSSVLTSVWTALTTDPELNAIVSDRAYHVPPRDAAWPYLTMRLDTFTGLDEATRPATLTLSAWDRGTNTERLHEIRAHILRVLDLTRLTTPDGIARFWHATTTWVPDEDDQVMRVLVTFTVRYARALEVARSLTQREA